MKPLELVFFILPILFIFLLPGIVFIQRRKELKGKRRAAASPGTAGYEDGWSIGEYPLKPETPAVRRKSGKENTFPSLISDGRKFGRDNGYSGEKEKTYNTNPALERITSLSKYRQAIIWKEILDKPAGLRNREY